LWGEVKLWNAETGLEIFTLKGYNAWVTAVCFSPDGKHFAFAGSDGTVMVCDAAKGQEVFSFKGHRGPVSSLCFSPDGRHLAWASLGFYQRNRPRGPALPDEFDQPARISPGVVMICDAATGQEILTLRRHTDRVFGVCFSPDGKRLATANWDGTVKVWDAATGQLVRTLEGHTKAVTSVCFSPDGQRLASASLDGTVKVWDADERQEVHAADPR
jgi:WD40 repeat protein